MEGVSFSLSNPQCSNTWVLFLASVFQAENPELLACYSYFVNPVQ